ncbi:hypothetical protein LIA77_06281 [Sarocladium implicatum]|nr:hypothetical protein LIA77_06281 [Sarocladium implicatum]
MNTSLLDVTEDAVPLALRLLLASAQVESSSGKLRDADASSRIYRLLRGALGNPPRELRIRCS